MDADLFLQCAEFVHARKDGDIDDNVEARATMLLDKLLNELEDMLPEEPAPRFEFQRRLQELCIVPLEHPATRERALFRFKDCCLGQYAKLVVFSMPPLPKKWVPPAESFKVFGIVSPPPFPLVMSSLANATEALLQDYPLDSTPTEDFCAVLAHLKVAVERGQGWNKGDNAYQKMFLKERCMPLNDTVLAAPGRTFFSVGAAATPPYVNQLPKAYAEHADLLRELGVLEKPTVSFYKATLEEVHRTSAGSEDAPEVPLSPGELNAVLKMIDASAGRAAFVPDVRGVMWPVQQTLYNDAPWLLPRMREGIIALTHPRLSREACERLGVRLLHSVVVERLGADDPPPVAVENPEAARLTAGIRSKEYASCLLELLRGENSGCPDVQATHARLKQFEVVFVETLQTRLFAVEGTTEVDLTEDGQAEGCLFFADLAAHRIYVARLPSHVDAASAVGRCVAKILLLPRLPPFMAQLLGCPPAEMHAYLVTLQVANAGEASTLAAASRGRLGAPLAEADRSVVQRLHRQHLPGECVAWVDHTGVRRYAEVVSTHATDLDESPWAYELRVGTQLKQAEGTSIFLFATPGAADAGAAADAGDAAVEQPAEEEEEEGGSEEDKARAVLSGLMRQLGIPLEGDAQVMLDALERSQRDVMELKKKLDAAEGKNVLLVRENETFRTQTDCKICFGDMPVEVALRCGHALCKECVQKLKSNAGFGGVAECPFCKAALTGEVPLFL